MCRRSGGRCRATTDQAMERYAADIAAPARAAGLWCNSGHRRGALAVMADSEQPQGVVAVVEASAPSLADASRLTRAARPVDPVRDPGNAGTVIRGPTPSRAAAVSEHRST